jgi:hypothetical protein
MDFAVEGLPAEEIPISFAFLAFTMGREIADIECAFVRCV